TQKQNIPPPHHEGKNCFFFPPRPPPLSPDVNQFRCPLPPPFDPDAIALLVALQNGGEAQPQPREGHISIWYQFELHLPEFRRMRRELPFDFPASDYQVDQFVREN